MDYQNVYNVWSSREYAQAIGKEYGSMENRTNGRRTDIVLLIIIRRGISLGDSLSPLLFVVAVIPLSMVFRGKQKLGMIWAKEMAFQSSSVYG